MSARVSRQLPASPLLAGSSTAREGILAPGRIKLDNAIPFERLLIAQSIEEDLSLVTADWQFSAYSVKLLQ
jgi:PIN domain nuclease of toxin-antitoxin system